MLETTNTVAGEYWDGALALNAPPRYRWWEDAMIRRHINEVVCGEPIDGLHAGFNKKLSDMGPFRRGISVGCGLGTKEFALLQSGAVDHFDLYEISQASVNAGLEIAQQQGLSDRITFLWADVFAAELPEGGYDLVQWNNALHHMPDVPFAVRWSRSMLCDGGVFAMDDFIGPTRFQWTDDNLIWASRVREGLSQRLIENPWAPGFPVSRVLTRETPEAIIAIDPSEAADSDRIIPSILTTFPDASITPTGGALYHLAMNDILSNFQTDDDLLLLRYILFMDQLLADRGTTHYGVAYARK